MKNQIHYFYAFLLLLAQINLTKTQEPSNRLTEIEQFALNLGLLTLEDIEEDPEVICFLQKTLSFDANFDIDDTTYDEKTVLRSINPHKKHIVSEYNKKIENERALIKQIIERLEKLFNENKRSQTFSKEEIRDVARRHKMAKRFLQKVRALIKLEIVQ